MRSTTLTTPPKKKKSQGRGRSNSLPGHVVEYLKSWLMSPEHINHPYPSESEKARMVADTGIEIKRLNNWFVNNRIRFWKPRFEAMQKQQENKKRKLSKPKENSVSSETSSVPVSKVPTREMPNTPVEARQEDTKVSEDVVSTPRLGLSHLVYTAINNTFATVSDDDSCSSSSSIDSSSKSNSKKTSMLHRCRKRQRREIENDDLVTSTPVESPPRFKKTCNDVEQWKHACLNSFSTYPKLDVTNLPSLDEAVQLFGYSVVASK